MKAQTHYEVDTDMVKAFEATIEALKAMEPKDRLEYNFHTIEILQDIIQQCKSVGQLLAIEDIMVSMDDKQYKEMFDGVRKINIAFSQFNIALTKKVPSLTEEVKASRKTKDNPKLTRLIS